MVDPDDILGYVVVTAVVIVPVLAISARIALRPIVESIARLRELTASAASGQARALHAELDELRATTARLREEVRALREGEAFYRALQAPREVPPAAGGSTADGGTGA